MIPNFQLHLEGELTGLTAMRDIDYGGDVVRYKSTLGHIVCLGSSYNINTGAVDSRGGVFSPYTDMSEYIGD